MERTVALLISSEPGETPEVPLTEMRGFCPFVSESLQRRHKAAFCILQLFQNITSKGPLYPLNRQGVFTSFAPSKKAPFSVSFTTPLHSFNPSFKGMRIALFIVSLVDTIAEFDRFQTND